jgi:hypothetical protein
MSHFSFSELLQQFRGFQRVGRRLRAIFSASGLEQTDLNVNLNAILYLNFGNRPGRRIR